MVRITSGKCWNKVIKPELTKSLLPQRNLLQFFEPVLLPGAVYHRVLQNLTLDAVVVDSRFDWAVGIGGLELPRVAALAVDEAWVVVTLIQELKHGREDFGLFVRKRDALRVALGEVLVQSRLEERRKAEDVLVSGEEAVLVPDNERDDGRGGVA